MPGPLLTTNRARQAIACTLLAAIWISNACLTVYPSIGKAATAKGPAPDARALHEPRTDTELFADTSAPSSGVASTDEGRRSSAAKALAKLPLSFEANQGQADGRVRYFSRGSGYNLFLTAEEAVLVLKKSAPVRPPAKSPLQRRSSSDRLKTPAGTALKMSFVGANRQARISGIEELPGKSNYFHGNNPRKWQTDVPNYARVKYEEVYPGIDLVYYGNQQQLEYDFVVAPQADTSLIKLRFDGIKSLRLADNGDLLLRVKDGEVRQHKPVSYQETAGSRREVNSRYVITGRNQVALKVDAYDKERPLVIDPTLSYSTYIGGSDGDEAMGIAVDSSNNIYVAGGTGSLDFPMVNAYKSTSNGVTSDNYAEIFLFKLNAAGTALIYSTYLGGSDSESVSDPTLDSAGNVYLAGKTYSLDFPTVNAFQSTRGGGSTDAYVTKVGPGGNSLVYSTYLGGNAANNVESASGVKVDAAGNAYIVGTTNSSDFPTTPNSYHPTLTGPNGFDEDLFVTKLDPTGTTLVYSTYLGGTYVDESSALALDASGNVYVTGFSLSTDYPVVNAPQPTYGGEGDVIVTKLNATGTALIYSTYLGGLDYDIAADIAVDSSGNAYLTGITDSSNFPTVNAYQSVFSGGADIFGNVYDDVFVTKLNATGSTLLFSTFVGGDRWDRARALAIDSAGNVYVTGLTSSTNFPRVFPFQSTLGGAFDLFFFKLRSSGSSLAFSTYLGGTDYDYANGVALDASGNAYIAGISCSPTYPTVNPFAAYNGTCDAIVSKITGLATYMVTGRVTDANGQGLSAVTMTVSGSSSATVQTDSGGNYSFPNLAAGGNFTITPSKSPYTFVPVNRAFTNLSTDQSADFTVLTYSVGGRVTNAAGAGESGVTMTLGGTQSTTVQTDASGYYSFPKVAAGGTYTVTPTKPDALLTYTFTPANRSVANLSANQTLADFVSSAVMVTALNPTADAYVQDGTSTNTNFGTATPLKLQTDNKANTGLNRDAYFKFDLSNISGNISSIKLRIYAALSATGSIGTSVYSVSSTTWIERGTGSINWTNKPARSASALTGATATVTGTAYAAYDLDVTAYVKSEKLAGRNVVSLALHNPSTSTPFINVNSREAATNKPQLIITTGSAPNAPPSVSLTTPANGAAFTSPASVTIAASAADADGTISKVDFYAGTTLIGTASAAPYQTTWNNVAAGSYSLTALATDNNGATSSSSAVVIGVNLPNALPSVSFNSPLAATTFAAGSNITLKAAASDADGTISKVEFFAGATLVGTATVPANGNTYSVVWNNVTSGAYSLTAKATDNASGATTSGAVNINVISQTGLSPTADAYVKDGSTATTNFGTATELQTQASATAGLNRESYLRFDLTTISAITNARIRLYGRLSDATATNVPAAVYSVASTTWVESGTGSVTWNTKPVAAATALSSATIKDNTARWYEFDVTSYIQNEKTAGRSIVSFVVKNTSTSGNFVTFNSREATTNQPQLVLWTTQARNALFVVGSTTLTAGDNAAKTLLQNSGYTVTVKAAGSTTSTAIKTSDADGKALVVISSSVTPANVTNKFRNVAVPVVTWEFDLLDDQGMTALVSGTDYGTTAASQTQLSIINAAHQMAAGLSGSPLVVSTASAFTWGKPNANAVSIATVNGDATKLVIFGYDNGASMPGLEAPARRVSLFLTDTTASSLNTSGGALFDAAIRWAADTNTAPVINSLTPTLGPVGTSVTISGSNFGATQGTSTLSFNGVQAAPASWSDKTIVAAVPLYASTGPVVVTVRGIPSNGLTFAVGQTDSDADGLPDSWELQYFGNLNQGPNGDPDGDGLTNLQEYQQGRNPTKSALADNGDFVKLQVYTPLWPLQP